MGSEGLLTHFQFSIGFIQITQSVLTSWLITFALFVFAKSSTYKLTTSPSRYQVVLEGIVLALRQAVSDVLPEHAELVFPFIARLWIFILISNVHWFGIRIDGLKNYLRHYIQPSPFLLPFHLISEISRTLALAVRLFGNIMSLELTAMMVLMVAGFLAPIPILMLHLVEAIVQAYIFGMLALMYIAGGIQSQELRREKESI